MDESLNFEIPGTDITDTPFESQSTAILRRVRELCDWGRPTFPGSQPVSLSASNLGELGRKPYVACEKTDGFRYLLFAASRFVFLIDRKETIRVLELFLPLKSEGDTNQRNHHQSTLLDGELVNDVLPDGTNHVCFLVYDIIALNRDTSVAKFNLLERLKLALLEVVRPRAQYVEEFPAAIAEEKAKKAFVSIYLKDFFEIWDVLAIRNAAKRLPHLSDGIIFTPVALPYVAGTCKGLMKWKPPELNTVDFAAEIVYALDLNGDSVPVGAKLLIGSRGLRRDSGYWIAASRGHWNSMLERQRSHQDCDGAIWECFYDRTARVSVPEFTKEDISHKVKQWESDHRVKRQRVGDSEMRLVSGSTCPYARVKDSLNFYDFSEAQIIEGGVIESIDSAIDFVALFDAILTIRDSSCSGPTAAATKPLHTRCQLPNYYLTHGSKSLETEKSLQDGKIHAEQAESIRRAGAAPQDQIIQPNSNNSIFADQQRFGADINFIPQEQQLPQLSQPASSFVAPSIGTDGVSAAPDLDDEIYNRKVSSSSSEEEE